MLRPRLALTLLLLLVLLGLTLHAQPANGTITGTFRTDDGKSLPTVIRAARTNPLPSVASSVKTTNGTFQITGLPPGEYELCMTVIDGGYVDPCLWDKSGVMVTLAAGQTLSTSLTARKGSVLKIRVDDPGNHIKNSREGALLIGVMGPGGRFYPAVSKAPAGNRKNYEVTVPFDREFQYTMRPVGLSVADSNNTNMDSGQRLTLKQSSRSDSPQTLEITYKVTGKK